MASVQDLINRVNGKKINTNGADNGQCTAIPHLWEEMNNWPVVLGNAKDTYGNAPGGTYDKTPNLPNNYPRPGAIIVWGPSWGGGFGHTGVVVSANANSFSCVEQNDGDMGLAHVGNHNYGGVLGWFTPRALEVVAVQAPAAGGTGPRIVPIKTTVNVRTAPKVTAPIVAQLHPGTCQITGQVSGDNGTVNGHTSNQWGVTLNGHYFNLAATE